ncbi:MAG: hypothetical protein GY777_23845 [Candidatus Brocadiaceae bacterium]|nr:hypothetical protein [Candidatus Brocadiaceae bacterium]
MTRLVLFALKRFKIKYRQFLNVPGDGILCHCLGSKFRHFLQIGVLEDLKNEAIASFYV